jgi:methylmalonyl-CoA mutase N-terminal domain/subunit
MKVSDHLEDLVVNGGAKNKQELRAVISDHVTFIQRTLKSGQRLDLVSIAKDIRIP